MQAMVRTAALIILILSVSGMQAQNRVIELGDLPTKSQSSRLTISGDMFSSLLSMGLARDTTVFLHKKTSSANIKLKNALTLTGTLTVYDDGFFCDMALEDAQSNKTKIEPVYGDHSEFMKRMDMLIESILRAADVAWTTSNRKKSVKTLVGIRINSVVNSRKESIQAFLLRDLYQVLSGSLTQANKNYQVTRLQDNSYSLDTLLCALTFDFALDESYSIRALPQLEIANQPPLSLPLFALNSSTDLAVIRSEIGNSYFNILEYLRSADGTWNRERHRYLDSVSLGPLEVINATIVKHANDTVEMPSLFLARKAAERYPDNGAFKTLGKLALKYGHTSDAISSFSKALEYYPDDTESQLYLGHTYYKRGDLFNSIKAFKRAISANEHRSFPNLGNVFLLAGKSYLSADSLDKAETHLQRSIEKFPNNLLAHFYLGVTLKKKKNYEKSIEVLETYLKKYPGDRNAQGWIADSHFLLGMQLKNNANYPAAIQQFRKAIRNNKNDYKVCSNILYTYNRMEDFAKADSVIKAGLAAKIFKLEEIYFDQGYDVRDIADLTKDLQQRDRMLKKAIYYLQKHRDNNPKDTEGLFLLGNTFFNAKEYSASVKVFKEAHKLDSADMSIKLDLAEALILIGKPQEVNELFPDPFISKKLRELKKSPSAETVLATYLKWSANVVLIDNGENYSGLTEDLSMHLRSFIDKQVSLSDWYYDNFKEWLAKYEGNNKHKLEEMTGKLEALTVNILE